MGEGGRGPGPDGGDAGAIQAVEPSDATASTDATDPDPLLVWSLATFHVTVLVALPVWVGHAIDPVAVGGLLDGLGTLAGAAVYLVLWGATWWSNDAWLREVDLAHARESVVAGAKWGMPPGVVVFLTLVALLVLRGVGAFAVFVAGIGIAFAAVFGALFGALFAGVDVLLFRVAGSLGRR